MKKIALIGCGQIGSRHLQALAKLKLAAQVYVVDPSTEAHEVAKARYEQARLPGTPTHDFIWLKKIEELPGALDFVVIATAASGRLKIIQSLFRVAILKYLLIEKVLFQSIEDLRAAGAIFAKFDTKVWVNCPFRVYPSYRDLRGRIDSPIHMTVTGSRWGLACNALHYLDLFTFLTRTKIEKIELSSDAFEVSQSKREGYLEIFGTVEATTKGGNVIALTAWNAGSAPVVVSIQSPRFGVTIREDLNIQSEIFTGQEATLNKKFEMLYQSQLTNLIIEEAFETCSSQLASFEESAALHELMLKLFTKLFCQRGIHGCPIT